MMSSQQVACLFETFQSLIILFMSHLNINRSFDFSGNPISKLPDEMCQSLRYQSTLFGQLLKHITMKCHITPDALNRNFSTLGLRQLPDCFSSLSYLRSLSLDLNSLTSLPPMKSLKSLFVFISQKMLHYTLEWS